MFAVDCYDRASDLSSHPQELPTLPQVFRFVPYAFVDIGLILDCRSVQRQLSNESALGISSPNLAKIGAFFWGSASARGAPAPS